MTINLPRFRLLAVLSLVVLGSQASRSHAETIGIVGASGTILGSTDGSTWTTQTSGTTNTLLGVSFANASDGWAVGVSGTIVATTDGGNTWSAQTSGTTNTLRSVSFAPSVVPEPSSWLLMVGMSALGVVVHRLRRTVLRV
jgi:hypothetical protein